MRRILFALVLLASVAGCEVGENFGPSAVKKEWPTVNLPAVLRQNNWRGPQGQGSCVHATMISLFRWQYRLKTADRWRQTYGDGEWPEDLAAEVSTRKASATPMSPTGMCVSWNGRAARGEGAALRSWAAHTWSRLCISTTSGPRSSITTTSRNSSGFRERR